MHRDGHHIKPTQKWIPMTTCWDQSGNALESRRLPIALGRLSPLRRRQSTVNGFLGVAAVRWSPARNSLGQLQTVCSPRATPWTAANPPSNFKLWIENESPKRWRLQSRKSQILCSKHSSASHKDHKVPQSSQQNVAKPSQQIEG